MYKRFKEKDVTGLLRQKLGYQATPESWERKGVGGVAGEGAGTYMSKEENAVESRFFSILQEKRNSGPRNGGVRKKTTRVKY